MKPLVSVKTKRKDGAKQLEVWSDGSKHESDNISFLTIFPSQSPGGFPYVVLAPEVKAALVKGGFPLDDFWMNAYIDGPSPKAPRGGRKVAPSADEFFDE